MSMNIIQLINVYFCHIIIFPNEWIAEWSLNTQT